MAAPLFVEFHSPIKWRILIATLIALLLHLVLLSLHFHKSRDESSRTVDSLHVTFIKKRAGDSSRRSGEVPLPYSTTPAPAPALTPPATNTTRDTPVLTTETISSIRQQSVPSTTTNPMINREPTTLSLPTTVLTPGQPRFTVREKYLDRESMTTLEDYYVQRWEERIEQVATANFPAEALARRLSGTLTLSVALAANGSVHSIKLLRSSGHSVLDQAAQQVVELAAPYAPFPEALRRQYDILHIPRTWKFMQGDLQATPRP